MRTLFKAGLLSGAALAIMVTATPGQAQSADCDTRISELNEMSSQQDTRWMVGGGVGQEIRELRNAAVIFARNGQEEACQEVVAGIEQMIEQRRENISADADAATDFESWNADAMQRIESAKAVGKVDHSLRAEEVIGADLRNMQNEDLGEIEDVVMSPQGDIEYAVVARGGFLGMGERLIAVPWKDLKVTQGDRFGERFFVLPVSQQKLEQAPSFERDSWLEVQTEEWRNDVENFFAELDRELQQQ